MPEWAVGKVLVERPVGWEIGARCCEESLFVVHLELWTLTFIHPVNDMLNTSTNTRITEIVNSADIQSTHKNYKTTAIAWPGLPQDRGRNCETNTLSIPAVVPRSGGWGISLIGGLWGGFGTSLLYCSTPARANLGLSIAVLGASVQIRMSVCQLV